MFLHWNLQIWDSRTGVKVGHFAQDATIIVGHCFSRDRRQLVAEICQVDSIAEEERKGTRKLLLIDLVEQKSVELPLKSTDVDCTLYFSNCGKYLARHTVNRVAKSHEEPNRLDLYATENGTWLNGNEIDGLVHPVFFTDELLLCYPTKANQSRIEGIHPRTGKLAATFNEADWYSFVAPSGPFLFGCNGPPDGDAYDWNVWNLRTFMRVGQIKSPTPYSVAPDGRYFMEPINEKAKQLTIHELPGGRAIVGAADIGTVFKATWSPDSRFLAVTLSETEFAMFNSADMTRHWTRETKRHFVASAFAGDGRFFFALQTEPRELHVYDSQTGALHARHPIQFGLGDWHHLATTPDGQSLLSWESHHPNDDNEKTAWNRLRASVAWLKELPEKHNDFLHVFDGQTASERFVIRGLNITSAILSDDGSVLATEHDWHPDTGPIRCWDVNAWKPLRWALGVPAGLATLIVLFAGWRGGRQRQRVAPTPENPVLS